MHKPTNSIVGESPMMIPQGRGSILNRDALYSTNAKRVANLSFLVLDTIQNASKEEQAAGVAAVFLLLSEELQVDPRVILEATSRMLTNKEASLMHFSAVRTYIRHELKDK
jgi:hypothetical protein